MRARRHRNVPAVAAVAALVSTMVLLGSTVGAHGDTSTGLHPCLVDRITTGSFTHCSIKNQDLNGYDFNSADLTQSALQDVKMHGASLSGAILALAHGAGIDGSPTFTTGTSYKIVNGYLVGSNADLSGANLSGADLSGEYLSNAGVVGTKFVGTSFNTATLTHVNFTGSTLSGGNDFSGGHWTSVTVPAGADLAGAQFGGVTVKDSVLQGVDFKGDILSLATLHGDDFDGANLAGTSLDYAKVDGGSMRHANLTGAVLSGARFSHVDLSGAVFSKSAGADGITWTDTTCPDGTISSNDRNTCANHLSASRRHSSAVRLGASAALPDASAARRVAASSCPTAAPAGGGMRDYAGCVLRGVRWAHCSLGGAPRRTSPNFHDATFVGGDLAGCDLSFANFVGATFLGSNLDGARLTHADLTSSTVDHAHLVGADLTGASFADASLTFTDLSRSFVGKGRLTPAVGAGVSFRGAYLWRDRFVRVSLRGAGVSFADASLNDCVFDRAAMSGGVDFDRAALSGTRLVASTLDGARFTSANLDRTALIGDRLGASTWSDATLAHVTSRGDLDVIAGHLSPPRLPAGWLLVGRRLLGYGDVQPGVVAPRANLANVNLGNAMLRGANLLGANLHGAVLNGAHLDGSQLASADLSDAYLITASLEGARLNRVDLDGANLSQANLANADLAGASLAGAIVWNVNWSNTICPDGTNSNSDGNTCVGHFLSSSPLTFPGQFAPTAQWVSTWSSGASYEAQLDENSVVGDPSFKVNWPNPHLAVSSAGLVTSVGGPLAVGSYRVAGTVVDDSGAVGGWSFELNVKPGTITQCTPTARTVSQAASGSSFADQLAASGVGGPATYVVTSANPHLTVSSTGAVGTVGGPLAPGTYEISGTVTDALGDTGTWQYELTVTRCDHAARSESPASGSAGAGHAARRAKS